MSGRPSVLLLDTNVWLANYIGERLGTSAAKQLVDYCLENDIALCVSAPSVKDVYYQIAAYLKRAGRADAAGLTESSAVAIEQIAWKCTCNLLENAVCVPLDSSDLAQARLLYDFHADFEDDIVLAAAVRAQADFLVTFDQRLLNKAIVPTLAPQDMLALLNKLAKR